mgnify:CR=1 FL=1
MNKEKNNKTEKNNTNMKNKYNFSGKVKFLPWVGDEYECGIKGFDGLYDFSDRMSPLGNASADECADYCVVMFSDLTKKVTMQTLFHDGGFSNMGMSLRGMTQYNKSFIDENRDENGKIIYG